jgi:hypothetical protein
VDAVQVWAYPLVNGVAGSPIFAGSAPVNQTRADIAAIYGNAFGASGFTLGVSGLTPGTYRLVVSAHLVSTGGFASIGSVDVTVASGN